MNVTRHWLSVLQALIIMGLSSCAEDLAPPLVVENIVVHDALPGSAMSVAYLALRNNSDADLHLTSIDSPNYGSVKFHTTVIEDGIAKMRQLETLTVPARGSVQLQRGGHHLMLSRRQNNDKGSVTLNFYVDSELLATVNTTVTKRSLP